jgi:O-antigen/teichoic acid export membrane protein
LLDTVIRSAFPYFVQWTTVGDGKKVSRYMNLMTLFTSGCYLIVFIAAYFLGPLLISLLFGKAYLPAARYLPLAVLAYWTISMQDIYRVALYSLKGQIKFLLVNVGGACVYVLVLLVLRSYWPTIDLITLILSSVAVANLMVVSGAMIIFYRSLYRVSAAMPLYTGREVKTG